LLASLLIFIFISVLAFPQGIVSLLDIGMGARTLGMGGAFTGLADDEQALFYNPAGLATLARLRLNSLYESRFGLASYGSVSLALRNFGLGIFFLNLGNIPKRDEQGRQVETFAYSQIALIGSFGLPLRQFLTAAPENLALGLRAKFYRVSTLQEGSGSSLALDPALMLDLGEVQLGIKVSKLRVGLIIENLLGLDLRYGSGHVEHWRLGLRLGASTTLFERLTAALDLETSGTLHLGFEYRLRELKLDAETAELALRLGAFMGDQSSLTFGLGLMLRNFQVDYAFIAHPQLPGSHRLSLALAFDMAMLPFMGVREDPEDP